MTGRTLMNALLVSVIAVAGCGKDTGTEPDDLICRNYSNNFTETSTNFQTGVTAMRTYSCGFSTVTNVLTCTSSRNGVGCETNTKQYGSTADFVDEVSVIPPRQLFQTETWTNISSCGGNQNRTDTYTYDAQRRVTGGTNSLGASTTYTAWDAAGRPTAANNSAGNNLSWTYNDSTRTKVLTVTGAASGTTTLVYDANGNLINTTSTVNPIGVTYSGSVAEVCR